MYCVLGLTLRGIFCEKTKLVKWTRMLLFADFGETMTSIDLHILNLNQCFPRRFDFFVSFEVTVIASPYLHFVKVIFEF